MRTSEARKLVEQFENGTYLAASWTHQSHVVMALWYLFHYPLVEARSRIKEGIKGYNLAQGGVNSDTEGYHETITEFYIQVLVRFLERKGPIDFDKVMKALKHEPCMSSSFPFAYYSKDRLMSVRARKSWVEPDLQAIPAYESTHPTFA